METIFKKKHVCFLLCLKTYKNLNLNQISKNLDLTYSHSRKLLKEIADLNLIIYHKHGRMLYIELTDAGYDFTNLIISSLKTINFKFIERSVVDKWGFESKILDLVNDSDDEYDWFTLKNEHQVKDVKTED